MSHRVSRWLSGHRRILLSIAAVGVGAALVLPPLAASSSAASRTASRTASAAAIPAAAARQLSAMTDRLAKMSGDAKPAWIEAVTTTRGKALRLATPGSTALGSASQTVYLVVMKGNFTLRYLPAPPNAKPPTGHYLAFTFVPATLQVLDIGLSKQPPPGSLASLGMVATLAR